MKKLTIFWGLLFLFQFLGYAHASLTEVQTGVIFDNVNNQYWIKDLGMFTPMTRAEQLSAIDALNTDPSFQGAWADWHLADFAEVSVLYYQMPLNNKNNSIFLPSDTGSDPWPSHFTWWWGRYNATTTIGDQIYDNVMHWTYRTWPETNPPENWFPDQNWGGLYNYIKPDQTEIIAGTWEIVSVGAWVTADPVPAPVPVPATLLLIGSGLAGVAGLRRRFGN
jgi:hypothetical protein